MGLSLQYGVIRVTFTLDFILETRLSLSMWLASFSRSLWVFGGSRFQLVVLPRRDDGCRCS